MSRKKSSRASIHAKRIANMATVLARLLSSLRRTCEEKQRHCMQNTCESESSLTVLRLPPLTLLASMVGSEKALAMPSLLVNGTAAYQAELVSR